MSWTHLFSSALRFKRAQIARQRRIAALAIGGGALAGSIVLSDHTSDRLAWANSVPPLHLQPANGEQPISLRDRLIVGLQARIASEIAFVDVMVLFVNTGQVPQRMVDQTFFWARDRAARVQNGNPRRAIIYFRPAMIARLRRLGVEI